MFQAVRRWWQSGRGKETSRLFVFELTVVMIGVLAAQQVSNWASNRSQIQEVEGLHGDLVQSFGNYRNIANTYDAAIPCLKERLALLLRLSASGKPIDPQLLSYAPIMLMGPDEIAPDDYRLLTARYGTRHRDLIGSVEFNLESLQSNGHALENEWFEFQRLNPENGEITTNDRAAVRGAAVKIMGYLTTLQKNADTLQNLTELLGIKTKPDPIMRPVTSCGEMWRAHAGFVERE